MNGCKGLMNPVLRREGKLQQQLRAMLIKRQAESKLAKEKREA